VIALLQSERLTPTTIVLTHGHLDHTYGIAKVKNAFPTARVLLHAGDQPLYDNQSAQAGMFGLPAPEIVPVDAHLVDGEILRLGSESLTVRHCPGHSPGHIVLIHETGPEPVAIVGDVLFAGSIGRTDLWGGSFEELERSIRQVLYTLPDNTRVLPGHGDETTIGEERRTNPFVSDSSV
jgi:hydroxyacylglutathione hydrolase